MMLDLAIKEKRGKKAAKSNELQATKGGNFLLVSREWKGLSVITLGQLGKDK